MLNAMRKRAGGVLAQILVGLLVVAFAIWGINDIFGGRSTSVVASVGDLEISADVFDLELQRALQIQADETGRPMSAQDARATGFVQALLNRMTTDKLIDVEASRLGLGIPDEMVARRIRENPVFRGPFGSFDRTQFEQLLYQNRYTEETYVERLRDDMRRVQLLDAVLAGIEAPDLITESQFRFQQEARAVKYILLPPELAGTIDAPSEEDLAKYYDEHQSDYMAPEYRAISVLLLSPGDLTSDIEVSEEDIRAEYDVRINDFTVPERRKVAQISFPTRDEADAAATRLREGADFIEIAEESGFSAEEIDLGLVRRDELVGEAIAEAAFGLQRPGIAGPVDGPLGSVILQVSEIQAGVTKPYEEVKSELRNLIALDRASDQVYEISNLVEDERAAGTTFEEIAEKYGLRRLSTEGVTARGVEANGESWSLPKNIASTILFAAFNSDVGQEIDMTEVPDGSVFWLQVDDVIPAGVRKLEEVRDAVVADWRDDTIRRKLQELAAQLVERGNSGESFEAIAAEFDKAVLSTPKPLVRWFSDDTFSLQAVGQVFGTPQGKFTYAPVKTGNSVVLMQVSEIVIPDPTESNEALETLRAQIRNDLGNDLADGYISALRTKTDIHINIQALDNLYGEGAG